jgi:hypothetical protein
MNGISDWILTISIQENTTAIVTSVANVYFGLSAITADTGGE